MINHVLALSGRRIIVAGVEKDIGDFVADAIGSAGGLSIGPANTLDEALALLSENPIGPDAAVVSLGLGSHATLMFADELIKRNVRFILLSAPGFAVPAVLIDCDVLDAPFGARGLTYRLSEVLAKRRGCIWSPPRVPDRL